MGGHEPYVISQTPEGGPANKDGLGPHGHGLEHVRAGPHPAVQVHLHVGSTHGFHNLRQGVDLDTGMIRSGETEIHNGQSQAGVS